MIHGWDNPETVRLRKYLTGTHLLLGLFDAKVAPTPGEVVWADGPARLVHYRYGTTRRFGVPVVLVYPPILRSYILDLAPGSSLVQYLLHEGFDVYLLDFGVPGYDDRRLTLDDYVLGFLPAALREAQRRAGTDEVTLIGHCMAGTLGAMYAASAGNGTVRNLVLVAAPIDFTPSRPGLLGAWTLWTRQRFVDPDRIGRAAETIPGDKLVRLLNAAGFAGWPWKLDPGALSGDLSFQAWLGICRWVDDGFPFPGAAFRQWYRDLFQHNSLVKGQQRLAGQPVDLGKITCPVLAVAGTLDAVTPLALARPWPGALPNSAVDLLTIRAGHVGMMVGPAGRGELWPQLGAWLAARSGRAEGRLLARSERPHGKRA